MSKLRKRKPHSEETKNKIALAHIGYRHSKEAKDKVSKANKGKHYSPATEFKKGQTGKNAAAWKGGTTPFVTLIRRSQKYIEWRQTIFIRDNFTCQKCKQRGGNLEVHHHKKRFAVLLQEARKLLPLFTLYDGTMVYTPLWDINCGITLCEKCHNKTKKGYKTKLC